MSGLSAQGLGLTDASIGYGYGGGQYNMASDPKWAAHQAAAQQQWTALGWDGQGMMGPFGPVRLVDPRAVRAVDDDYRSRCRTLPPRFIGDWSEWRAAHAVIDAAMAPPKPGQATPTEEARIARRAWLCGRVTGYRDPLLSRIRAAGGRPYAYRCERDGEVIWVGL